MTRGARTPRERRALLAYAAWWRGELPCIWWKWDLARELLPSQEDCRENFGTSARLDIAESLALEGLHVKEGT